MAKRKKTEIETIEEDVLIPAAQSSNVLKHCIKASVTSPVYDSILGNKIINKIVPGKKYEYTSVANTLIGKYYKISIGYVKKTNNITEE